MRRLAMFVFLSLGLAGMATAALPSVDFRYAPPDWQAAICLPDDPCKSLVSKGGELLYHYNQGGREFGTRIAVAVVDGAVWRKQELFSPRTPIVRTYWTAPGLEIVEEAFAVTPNAEGGRQKAEERSDLSWCGKEPRSGAADPPTAADRRFDPRRRLPSGFDRGQPPRVGRLFIENGLGNAPIGGKDVPLEAVTLPAGGSNHVLRGLRQRG